MDRPFSLGHDDLRCLPKVEAEEERICRCYFVHRARLAGQTLASVIALAAPQAGAHELTLIAVNGYKGCRFDLAAVQGEDNFLVAEPSLCPLLYSIRRSARH